MNNRLAMIFCLVGASLSLTASFGSGGSAIPSPVIPEGLGVNIHFTDPRSGEMEMLVAAGLRWVRMDLFWENTEVEKGKYDFSAYDRLLTALKPHKIRALFILDYANRFYDDGLSPHTEAGRRAFASWVKAAVVHFRDRGILWEMYNEPNGSFWRPKPNVDDYIALARAVGEAIRKAAPKELYVGPATSGIDLSFLDACFKAGLLDYWDAVSVHPYRNAHPETAEDDYARLRELIARHAPNRRRIPILSGEWGYSAVWSGMDEEKQGQMLARQWLSNLAGDIPLSIWYDWHDDGDDPDEPEHHFGMVSHAYHVGRNPVYDAKPAYWAARAVSRILNGFRFERRFPVGGKDDYVHIFRKGTAARIVAWTSLPTSHEVAIPIGPGRFQVISHKGETLGEAAAESKLLTIILTDAPHYLVPTTAKALGETESLPPLPSP